MVFPGGGPEPRHPSQLYEALLEGIVLFIVLRILTNRLGKLRQPGFVSGAFAAGYGVGAHLRRVLPRARHPDRLPRRRPHHGHAPVDPDDRGRRRPHALGLAAEAGGDPRRVTPLGTRIAALIAANGPITVADYMALCLGDPEHGYYMAREPFGRGGDFVTAPEVSQVFGELIGLWAVATWQAMGSPSPFVLAELGPGRGTLMADLLRAARRPPRVPRSRRASTLSKPARGFARRRRRCCPGVTVVVARGSSTRCLAVQPSSSPTNSSTRSPSGRYVRKAAGWAERMVGLDDAGRLAFGLRDIPRPVGA